MVHPADKFLVSLEDLGWKGQIIPIKHLSDLKKVIQGVHERGLIDEQFYQENLTGFSFNPPETLTDSQSIIIIAVPVPMYKIVFHWNGERWPISIPPTYIHYTATHERVQAIVAGILMKEGFRTAGIELPLKTLAVSSGLAEYGRNNICYVPGMGSFLQLVGCFTDLPGADDPWQESRMLERCNSCRICMHRCPTEAITHERILLHAERCLTYHNEKNTEIPFPDWINPSWHNCLIGCMHCQQFCPENESVLTWIEEISEFSEDETALLMDYTQINRLPAELMAKLQSLGLSDIQAFPRNLAILLNHQTIPV
jgi:epoxyqueuosine reductase